MFWTLRKAGYRGYQYFMKPMVAILPFPVPELCTGPGSVQRLPEKVRAKGVRKAFVVTDKGVMAAGLFEGMRKAFEAQGISCALYDEVQPNPSIPNVEDALKCYLANRCDGIVALGGGSPMDCAKLVGARATNPKRSVRKMRGMFKVFRKLPPFFAVPTTAGTGSETTVVAVVTDPETHEKFAVIDLHLVPAVAVLDPELMLGLPPHITAATGMDALTHAVESYIGLHGTRRTEEHAEKATRLIFENLEQVYRDGSNLERRHNMALASFYAGAAFTKASVGYVHAIAHNLGGLYGVPHGLANAVILPRVLEFCVNEAAPKLARLGRAAGIAAVGDPDATVARRFIDKVEAMNRAMQIPTTIRELQAKDIPLIAERALKEANPAYPVPRIMDRDECEGLVRQLLP
jgi:alcohol dehydrogenase